MIYPEDYDVIPAWFGYPRSPMYKWETFRNLSVKKKIALRELCQEAGMVICTCIFFDRNIVLIDVDIDSPDPKRDPYVRRVQEQVLDIFTRYKLPIKITWHEGVHLYIPCDKSAYPHGVLIKLAKWGRDDKGVSKVEKVKYLANTTNPTVQEK